AHDARGPGGAHAGADLDPDRQDRALLGRARAGAAIGLVEQVLKLGALALEPGRAHVGDVVGDDFDIALLRAHAGGSDVQGFHGLSPHAVASPRRWMALRRMSSWRVSRAARLSYERVTRIISVISRTPETLERSIWPC